MGDSDDVTEASHDGTDAERLTRVESKLDTLADAVAKLVPGSHADAQQREERKLDRPSATAETVQEQVRAELARARQEDADTAERTTASSHRESTDARLARLEEKPPVRARPALARLLTKGWD